MKTFNVFLSCCNICLIMHKLLNRARKANKIFFPSINYHFSNMCNSHKECSHTFFFCLQARMKRLLQAGALNGPNFLCGALIVVSEVSSLHRLILYLILLNVCSWMCMSVWRAKRRRMCMWVWYFSFLNSPYVSVSVLDWFKLSKTLLFLSFLYSVNYRMKEYFNLVGGKGAHGVCVSVCVFVFVCVCLSVCGHFKILAWPECIDRFALEFARKLKF